ncbi:isocitrate lyase/PEP mutase family protein [Diaphorobacter caeni]|uniref:isocitrate lyase/PEP mutase family protein n=1 Tax=Diaphorobacter caeni TaxID=2784387 RepID=UPI00188F21F3|nr:isocitrate lyase/PEP mutase family protein [Diaphorobacter caeni]MBF5007101.1 isocitrate lyase/PEP mutase family protein [Diaphorobacter caeni]
MTQSRNRLAPGAGPAALRQVWREHPFVIAPGVHDLFSLRIVESAGFSSAAISGAVLSQALLGMPDVGLLTLTEAVEHCRRLTRMASIPVTADADAGYGNPLGVYHTVQMFEEAGAAGINLEDQVVPRRFGAGSGKEVVPEVEMVAKIRAACTARRSSDFALIVRTDAFACEDQGSVVRRCRAYQDAGADVVMPIAPKSEADIEELVRVLDVPVSLNVGTGLAPARSAGMVPVPRLRELGVRRVSLPSILPVAAAAAMANALGRLQVSLDGKPVATEPEPLELAQIMGDAEWLALESQLLNKQIQK